MAGSADGRSFVATPVGLPAPPTVGFDPTTAGFNNGRTPILTGTVSAGAAGIELYDDGQDLGAAVVSRDGTWTFQADIGAGDFHALSAVATDTAGQGSSAVAPYAIETGVVGQPYRAVEYDDGTDGSSGYREFGRSGALLVDAADNGDGTHAIQAYAAGQRLDSVAHDAMTGFGARDTFAFVPGFGRDEVTNFAVTGPAHDTLDLSATSLTSLAQVLSHTTVSVGNAVIHLDARDTVTLAGVSKAQLFYHAGDFTFA